MNYRVGVYIHKLFDVNYLVCSPESKLSPGSDRVAKAAGFRLHARVAVKVHQRDKLERPGGAPLCRYIARPAVSENALH